VASTAGDCHAKSWGNGGKIYVEDVDALGEFNTSIEFFKNIKEALLKNTRDSI